MTVTPPPLPQNWEMKRLKYVVSCNDEMLNEDVVPDHLIDYIEISDVSFDKGVEKSTIMQLADAPNRARRIVRDGDILVSTVRTYLRAIAVVDNPPDNAIASTGFAVIRPKSINGAFLGYLFHNDELIGQIISRSVGVSYPSITSNEILTLKVPVPPIKEQQIIVSILNLETQRIDGLIEHLERLIKNLNEKRQAVISNAITCGVNPDTPDRISELMPNPYIVSPREASQVMPLKYVASCNDEMLQEDTAPDEQIDYIEISDVTFGKGVHSSTAMQFANAPSRARRIVRAGDVLVSTVRTYLRAIAVVQNPPDNAVASTGFAVLRPRGVNSSYLGYLCHNDELIAEIISRSVGVSYPSINSSDIMGIKVPVPGLREQQTIATHLDQETNRIDALVEKLKQLISLLNEKRQALISAAVTGQIPLTDMTLDKQPEDAA